MTYNRKVLKNEQCVPRPAKINDVLKRVRECLEKGRYYDTRHAKQRKLQRRISLAHVMYVLRHGYHEKRKDQYSPEHDDWAYAIRGKTIDETRDLRIVIAFDEDDMLIITVIEITKGT